MKAVKYQFELIDISAHLLQVTLQFSPQHAEHELSLPAWIPGSYMIRDFARNITAISAQDTDGALAIQQLDKQRWLLQCNNAVVTVRYQIYAYDMSVRAAYIDDEIAVLNPACLCLSVNGLEQLSHNIKLSKPASALYKNWRVATGLARDNKTAALGFGLYHADNYANLIDSPLLLGQFSINEFTVNGISHYLVVSGDNLTDLQRFSGDMQRICEQQVKVFGSLPADLTQYWFLLWVSEDGYGGLEHMNSTLLLCSRYDLPSAQQADIDDNYENLLALCSHEYFHTWWVKRLKPACFHPYQLDAEQYTTQLWLYEGFTSYFDDLALVRAGIIDTKRYLKTLEKTISRVTRNPSNEAQSLTESSFTAWTKFYKQDENAVNAVVSYYAKGALLALCLEAKLRAAGSSLQQLVRQLWQDYLATGTGDDALYQALHQLGHSELAALSQQWLNQPAPLPLTTALTELGLNLTLRSMLHADDLGGEPDVSQAVFIGAQTKVVNNLLQLTQVYHGGAAHQAGLMVGDQLLAVDGRKINASNLSKLLPRYAEGSRVELHFYRKDRLLACPLLLRRATQQVANLSIANEVLCRHWLENIEVSSAKE
ncbi:M61 family metallopeptidase [Rheinheimera maricola]|uniref:PDZ domain-containing protein n=1 Tax=Rheinheimera maricola TaxID=2793282 RepID=A0ABS7X6S3_9GAMM|nr:PDZ domain-containing protein [Rheinheimera maricola]MBZ9610865.1 PDZ domain-containing protein [Rheinheimera maricola]